MAGPAIRAHCLQHVAFEGLGSIEPWLRAAGASLSTTRLYERGHVLPHINDIDLLIVMGGSMSANDDQIYPWLVPEVDLIRSAIERQRAVLGVCLGAQLMARAMGARVFANHEREIGWLSVSGLSEDSLDPGWARRGANTTVFHWHGDTFDLPYGAVPLAASAGCACQAFRIGDSVMALQFHLETTPASAQELVSNCRSELVASRFVQSEAEILEADDARYAAVNALMGETLRSVTRALRSR